MNDMNNTLATPAAGGAQCPRCCAPAGHPCKTGCPEAGLASAMRKAIDMLAQVDVSKVPLAVPAALGVLRCALDVEPAPQLISAAARDVLGERQRQMEVEGWTPEHDDEHGDGQMARAAACYAMAGHPTMRPIYWPWAMKWWKPRDKRRNLVRAAALLIAEIERVDRALTPKGDA